MSINDFFQSGFVLSYLNDHTVADNISVAILVISTLLCIIVPYLLGSLNFAIIISGKTYKQDIREYGSKNAGMTNMMRTYGKKAAGLTLLGDALKAIVAGLIGYALLGQLGAYIAGCACVIGHMYPVFFKFKGGKGVVTAAMSIMMCNPYVFVIILVLFIAIVAISKYISLGSVMCVIIYPFILAGVDAWLLPAIVTGDEVIKASPYIPFALLISVLVIFKHRENIKRLRMGTESKFSFKKSVKSSKEAEEKTDKN